TEAACVSFLPPADLGERGAGDFFAPVPDPPDPLDLLVDRDQRLQRLRAVPPAELGAGDDPGVLVEPALHVAARALRMRVDPGRELVGALGERNLVSRLLRRAWQDESRSPLRRGLGGALLLGRLLGDGLLRRLLGRLLGD